MSAESKQNKQVGKFSQVCLTSARIITWKISGFRHLLGTASHSLDSPHFNFDNSNWCLRIYPKSDKIDGETIEYDSDGVEDENNWYRNKKIHVEAQLKSSSDKNIKSQNESEDDDSDEDDDDYEDCDDDDDDDDVGFIGFTIVRLNYLVPHQTLYCNAILKGKKNTMRAFVSTFDENGNERGKMNFIDRSQVLNQSSYFLQKDTLTLICQLFSEGPPSVDISSQTHAFTGDTTSLEKLCQNYRNLLLTGQDHDVTLRVKDKELRAHRNILRARSPVLGYMVMSHGMVEKNSCVVDIPDCDPVAFQQFLIYLYSGEVETLDASNMLALYYVADKYGVGCLKEICRQFIKRTLSPTNVSEVIQLSLNHSDADLLKCTTEYFVKETIEILPTVEWRSFVKQNPRQANELFIKAAENFNDLIRSYRKDKCKILRKNTTQQ